MSKSLKPLKLLFHIQKNRYNNYENQMWKYFVNWKYYADIQEYIQVLWGSYILRALCKKKIQYYEYKVRYRSKYLEWEKSQQILNIKIVTNTTNMMKSSNMAYFYSLTAWHVVKIDVSYIFGCTLFKHLLRW